MTPFWLPKVVAIACAIVYIFFGDSGRISKITVGALVILSLLLQHAGGFAGAWAVGLVLQAGVSIFIIVSFKTPS